MRTEGDSALLDLDDVHVAFPREEGPPVEVLAGVRLALAARESLAVLGPAGGGKTTLLKAMAGILPPDRGRVRIGGEDVYSARFRRGRAERVGMAFQRGGLFDSMSVAENLRFPLREVLRLRARELEPRVEEALADVALEGQGALAVSELSGGMQKRLGIARALILRPALVLLDEPTAGLDPITARTIVELVLGMREKYGMAMVVVTSDLAVAFRCADRIAFLWRGTFRAIDETAAIRESRDPAVRQFLDGALEGPLTAEVGL